MSIFCGTSVLSDLFVSSLERSRPVFSACHIPGASSPVECILPNKRTAATSAQPTEVVAGDPRYPTVAVGGFEDFASKDLTLKRLKAEVCSGLLLLFRVLLVAMSAQIVAWPQDVRETLERLGPAVCRSCQEPLFVSVGRRSDVPGSLVAPGVGVVCSGVQFDVFTQVT